jgi:choline dehydrogenase
MPLVDPNYLAEPEDWTVSIEGRTWARRIFESPALADRIKREHTPGPEVASDQEIRSYIRRFAKTDYHPVGSCKMGCDELAVVDDQLRVRGRGARTGLARRECLASSRRTGSTG